MKVYRKEQFEIPEHKHYFCGHSLGPISKSAKLALLNGAHQWETEQVCAWEQSQWIDLPEICGQKIAPLIGASHADVIVCDNTTLNLFKVLLCALSINPKRNIILTQIDNFPTDNYIAQSVANLKDVTYIALPKEDILTALNSDVAVLLLTHVDYLSANKWDMAHINQMAKAKGIVTIWDLSHSVGVMNLHCAQNEVDFAVGCTYKYLNGGPGAPSFIYVNPKHQDHLPLQGWMGHATPFAFLQTFHPAIGVKRFLSGTPSILSMKTLLGALEHFDNVDLPCLEKKSQALTTYLIEKCAQFLPAFKCLSPQDPLQRGSHVAFYHPDAQDLVKQFIKQGIIVDYRNPNVIRFGISPLYLNKADIDNALAVIQKCLQSAKHSVTGIT
ncbi:MAG: kynureninase [Candidatus Berkiella sp.]